MKLRHIALVLVAGLAVAAVAATPSDDPSPERASASSTTLGASSQEAATVAPTAGAAAAGTVATTPPTTAPPTTVPQPIRWVEPPVVAVPMLAPGSRPVIPVPGTDAQVRFMLDIVARPIGNSQITYEHATATGGAVPNDPLVSPGNGSHPHDFAGTVLPDSLPSIAQIHAIAPKFDPASKMAEYGMVHWANGVGHQPGLWHPSVWIRGGEQVEIGAGSALNYVRDPLAHLPTDRLFLLPNGVGWVTEIARIQDTGDGKWRITFDGPTWARRSLLEGGPIDEPLANHDMFWFERSRPPWADSDGIALAKVSWYFKSRELRLEHYPDAPPEFSYAGPDTDITLHMDYVSSSTPLPALDGIQLGQWMLDMTVNAHLFGGSSPLYGRWQLEPADPSSTAG